MRWSNYFLYTEKEVPADANTLSHKLMLKAGLIKKLASGIYTYLPMAYKILNKIENIVREELNKIGAVELLMPALHPKEVWLKTGRWYDMGDTMFRLKDRQERDFCLGMTHEEIITDVVMSKIKSYKELPKALYQIQSKFRDEPRPRGGVIRAREFIMKDLYSFHTNYQDLEQFYEKVYQAYLNIFKRLDLNIAVVEADPGPIGGNVSHEFHVVTESGEDKLFLCPECGYAANKEVCEFKIVEKQIKEQELHEIEEVYTPDVKTISDLVKFLKIEDKKFVKSMLYKDEEGKYYLVLVRGDREINEFKLKKALKLKEIYLAEEKDFSSLSLVAGFLGPVNIKEDIFIVADYEVKGLANFVVGANKKDYHLKNVNLKDFKIDLFADIRSAVEGDLCPKCGAALEYKRGIELGHIFKLGTKYSAPMQAFFLNKEGKAEPMIMGCYGIGISRLMPAIIETHSDKYGIIWPESIAPFKFLITQLNMKDKKQTEVAEKLYNELKANNVEVLYDDRDFSAGFKFKDADLIGIPYIIIVGKKVKEGLVELKDRKKDVKHTFKIEEVISKFL